jgi:hypothetical protein
MRDVPLDPEPAGQILMHNGPGYTSVVQCLSLNAASIFLFCGLVFGVVYLSTIVLKNALGIIVGAGVLAGYVIVSALLDHYTGIKLPDLLLRVVMQYRGDGIPSAVNFLGISMAIRAGLLLLFPIAAQLVLERSDI